MRSCSSAVTWPHWPDSQSTPVTPLKALNFPRLTLGRRSFQNVTRMPTLSSGVGSCGWPAQMQEGQRPGLYQRGWESLHPSCPRSSISSSCMCLDKQGMEKAGKPSISQEGHSVLLSMMPDFPTAEALTCRASRKISVLGQRDRHTEAWCCRG